MESPLKIGITCYPSVGGSGILACALGEELAQRGHEVHFISYERPVRMPVEAPRVYFHPVSINDYGLFKYPDYTLPLSVKMAGVSRACGLDILHAHYAVPHATAAILAKEMLPPASRPSVITTLHGTDTTLLGRDAAYAPAIRHALECSDGVTTVSEFMRRETHRLLATQRPIEVIHNFFDPKAPARSRAAVRAELGVRDDEVLILHHSNLRPVKRIDLLLEAVARVRSPAAFKLVVLAGGDFTPYRARMRQLGLDGRVIVQADATAVEDYLQAADLGLFTSESESFCLSILEAMAFGRPSVSTRVGGIPEVVTDGVDGVLVPFGDADALARSIETLLDDPARRAALGRAAQKKAREMFGGEKIVDQYVAFYRRVRAAR
jgi:N-acetyl-alpha-D-glucosaminyl L-malate synthase BshA